MIEFLSTYSAAIGMTPASAVTTVFGAFIATFCVIVSWPKLVEKFGPIGGFMAAAFVIGTFWLLNHKLPGWGINPDQIAGPDGHPMQFGLINQAFHGSCPWVDMGSAIFAGFWVNGIVGKAKGERMKAVVESLPRIFWALLGGVIGGVLTGLVGFSGAKLFN